MPRESGHPVSRKCSWARLCTTRRSTFTGSPAFAGDDAGEWRMQFWIIQTLNSIAFGGLLFLLSSGFSLAFGLMRIPNLAHGSFFMLGAYLGATITYHGGHFWIAVLGAGLGVGLLGIAFERLILRRLAGNVQGQVLVTLGISFIIADLCLLIWTGDPWTVPAPPALRPPLLFGGFAFPTFRLIVLGIALVTAVALYLLMERT